MMELLWEMFWVCSLAVSQMESCLLCLGSDGPQAPPTADTNAGGEHLEEGPGAGATAVAAGNVSELWQLTGSELRCFCLFSAAVVKKRHRGS